MESKRNKIDIFRQKLSERNADSTYTNQFLYSVLMEHAKWLIKREVSAGRVYKNNSLFQPFVVDVIEVPIIDSCLNITGNCKIYRSKDKIPDMWTDNDGPIIRDVTSIDGSTDFFVTNAKTWQSKSKNPYTKMSSTKYAFFSNDYLWIPQVNPNTIIINGFYKDDLDLVERTCQECQENKECVRFLDTKFMVPDWVEAEMFSKALEQMAGITRKLPVDLEMDKNAGTNGQ